MDQERFDDIAKKLSSGSSRRSVLGAAIAGAFGAGLAKVSGADAKGGKKGRKKARKEAVCLGGECGPNACCLSTPPGNNVSCVTAASQLAGGEICGDGIDGSGICRRCPDGTRCAQPGGPGTAFVCVCDATTCPNGCCYEDTNTRDFQCIVNGSGQPINSSDFADGAYVCGTGGSSCNFCSFGPQIFSGCCSATGVCQSGTTGSNCGNSGELCEVCDAAAGEECGVDQTCTGRTTTPPPPDTTCGPGTANPCTNGCCAETSPGVFRCESGGAKNACGTGGVACKKCGGHKKCSGKGRCKKIKK